MTRSTKQIQTPTDNPRLDSGARTHFPEATACTIENQHRCSNLVNENAVRYVQKSRTRLLASILSVQCIGLMQSVWKRSS